MRVFLKSKLLWALPILTVACYYAAKHTAIELKAYAQVQATPFVLETYSYSYSSGDLLEKRVTARRSDGSTSEVFTMGPHLKLSARTVTSVSGPRLNVLDFVSLTKWNTKSSELAALKDRLMTPLPIISTDRSNSSGMTTCWASRLWWSKRYIRNWLGVTICGLLPA